MPKFHSLSLSGYAAPTALAFTLACSAAGGAPGSMGVGGAGGAGFGGAGSGGAAATGGFGVGGSSGSGGLAGCVGESVAAEKTQLDIYIMLDKSSSMFPPESRSRWADVTAAIKSFVQQPGAAGIGVGLQYFPVPNASCWRRQGKGGRAQLEGIRTPFACVVVRAFS